MFERCAAKVANFVLLTLKLGQALVHSATVRRANTEDRPWHIQPGAGGQG